jgi:TonB-linked SusC/RagA family outer membrane protein
MRAGSNADAQLRPLIDVLEEFGEKYQVFFSYDSRSVASVNVDFSFKNGENLDRAIDRLLAPTNFRYEAFGEKYFVIYEQSKQGARDAKKLGRHIKKIQQLEAGGDLSLQRTKRDPFHQIQTVANTAFNLKKEIEITGSVKTQDGTPLIGATIYVKETNTGTATDFDGNYSLSVSEEAATLIISYTGYQPQEIAINGRTVIDIVLIEDISALQEIVVIGYGTVNKKDITGAISSLDSKNITRANPIQTAKALQGQVAGVNIVKVNSRPGADFNIDIRGLSSFDNSNAPLIVIDGVIGGTLNTLNPSDIESIDVLKDASATAIYGSRGGNGVIIVTTKRGAEGKPTLSYDSYVGVKTPAHLPEMMTAQQFYKTYNDNRLLDGGNPARFTSSELAMIESGQSTDWVDLVTDPGLQTGQSLAVSGGGSNTNYHFSAGYLREEGNLISTDFNRYNIKGTMDSRLNDLVRVGFSAYYSYSIRNLGSNETLRSAYRARPTGTLYYDDLVNPAENNDLDFQGYAVWMGINDKQVLSPVVEADPDNFKDEERISSLLGNLYVELTPIKNLSFKSSLSTSTLGSRWGQFRGTMTKDRLTSRDPRAWNENRQHYSYTWDNILTYNIRKGAHDLTFTGVQSVFQERFENYASQVDNLPYDSEWYALGTAGTLVALDSRLEEKALLSYMGRVNYGFKDKYLLTLTGRWDGSSVLAEGNKWAFFPSAAFAWRMDEEDFIQNLDLFSSLKFRVSYGIVGNDVVAPYQTQARLINTAYDFGGSAAFGFAPAAISNTELRWEKNKEINMGINMGFVRNRIEVIAEVYKRNTVDLILNQLLPTSTGFSSVTSNIGEILNQGLELTLNTVNVHKSDFRWSTSFNFSTNHNEILELYGGDVTVDKGNALFVGESLRSNFFYEFDGIWQLDEADQAAAYGQSPGSVRVVDQNNDGKISAADAADDRVVLGNELPKWLAGMRNNFNYKNWDLSFFIYTRQGAQFRNQLLSGTFGDLSSDRYNRLNVNYWTSENPTNDFYGVAVANPFRQAIQYQEANFVRISDITLGFSLPQGVLDRLKFSNFRVYGQVSNPFVFTNYLAMDPEFNSNVYQDDVPSATYIFGVNLSF